jgi:hypothetical protein
VFSKKIELTKVLNAKNKKKKVTVAIRCQKTKKVN